MPHPSPSPSSLQIVLTIFRHVVWPHQPTSFHCLKKNNQKENPNSLRPECSDPNPFNQCLSRFPIFIAHYTASRSMQCPHGHVDSAIIKFSKNIFLKLLVRGFSDVLRHGVDHGKSFGVHSQVLAQIVLPRPVQVAGSHCSAFKSRSILNSISLFSFSQF